MARSGTLSFRDGVMFALVLLVPQLGWTAAKVGVAYRGWRVQDVDLIGVEGSVARTIKDGLALAKRQGLLLGRLRRPSYQPELLAEDMRRVRLYLATRGYPRVQVHPTLIPNEAKRRLTVELRVDLGSRVLLDSVEVSGLPPGLELNSKELGIQAGEGFEDAKLVAARGVVLQKLLARGYAAARVERQLDFADSTRVRVRFVVDPGDVYHVRDIEFEGASEDLRKLARRTLGLSPGSLSTPKSLSDGSKRLQRLQLFRRVELETPRVGPGQVSVKCRLAEREPRTLGAGIGAWSDGIIQGRAGWTHRNLFRGGRGLGVGALASKVEQELSLAVWQPSILGPKTRATAIVRGRYQNEDTYESSSLEFETNLTFSFDVDRDHHLQTGIVFARVDYARNTQEVEQPEGHLVTAQARWLNDKSDDTFYPRRGYVLMNSVESTIPGLQSTVDFVWLQLSAVYYQPLPHRSVLAFRLTPGYALPYGSAGGIPPDRLFYAGGALSMRGFARRELGPRDSEGIRTGGRVLVEFSSELRTPAWWRFNLAAFLDAAQVWVQPSDMRFGDMEIAVGPGLGFETPIGPIRADFGFRLTDYDLAPSWRFHLYIGKPF